MALDTIAISKNVSCISNIYINLQKELEMFKYLCLKHDVFSELHEWKLHFESHLMYQCDFLKALRHLYHIDAHVCMNNV
jgi:hypothetical protein